MIKVQGIRAKLNSQEQVRLSVRDLKASSDLTLRDIAATKPNRAAGKPAEWIGEEELDKRTGWTGSSAIAFAALANEVRRSHFKPKLIETLRASASRKAPVAPAPLRVPASKLASLSRKAFVPLAEYVAARFVDVKSFRSAIAGDKVFYFDGSDIVAKYSLHEIQAALAILTARQGGFEFGVSKSKQGRHQFVQGFSTQVELDSRATGLDLLFHTHPANGPIKAQPSAGDMLLARDLDPNHHAAAVSQDGWLVTYESKGARQMAAPPKRIWAEP
jgi:hypothetical protein